tara:strand:+ start:1346 stop:1672 length:327 start_codon:yes stop_codon:yes gene_type:complete
MGVKFPSSKSLNQVVHTNGVSYKWDGRKFKKLTPNTLSTDSITGLATSVASTVDSAYVTGILGITSVANTIQTTVDSDYVTALVGYQLSIVSALPGSPDANTIYFVTG